MPHTTRKTLELLEKACADKGSEYHKIFQEICKRHEKTVPTELLLEIREDGTNTFVNLFDGPVHYGEVVKRAAKKIGVKEELTDNLEENELLIVGKIVRDYWEKMPEEERQKIYEKLKEVETAQVDAIEGMGVLKGVGAVNGFLYGNIGIMVLIEWIGIKAVQRILMEIMLVFAGRLAAQQAARFIIGAFIPFLNIVMAAWLIVDIAGPAYRKIVPTVISIAMLRMYYNSLEA